MHSILKDVCLLLNSRGTGLMVEGEGEFNDNPDSHQLAQKLSSLGKDEIQIILLWEILRELKKESTPDLEDLALYTSMQEAMKLDD